MERKSRKERHAENLKKFLKKVGMRQVDLARWLNIGQGQVSQICRGHRAIGEEFAKKLVKFFGEHGLPLQEHDFFDPEPRFEPPNLENIVTDLGQIADKLLRVSGWILEDRKQATGRMADSLQGYGSLVGECASHLGEIVQELQQKEVI